MKLADSRFLTNGGYSNTLCSGVQNWSLCIKGLKRVLIATSLSVLLVACSDSNSDFSSNGGTNVSIPQIGIDATDADDNAIVDDGIAETSDEAEAESNNEEAGTSGSNGNDNIALEAETGIDGSVVDEVAAALVDENQTVELSEPADTSETVDAAEAIVTNETADVIEITRTDNPDPIASLPRIALTPLPSTPLTPAPNAADEPVAVSGPVSTVSEYFLVRDGGGPIPEDTSGDLTLADFNAGLQEPRISVPSGVDTTTNPAPFFEGLTNQTVFAGEALEIVLRPTDSDGTNPGMFPELIPSNAQYIDNFNRTKTVRWIPLQPDVGFHEMKFTAVDFDAPQYRAEYTVLVQVLLPADQSGIQNLAPGINALRRHTAQVNDPVVVEILGTDPNGTVPTLEVLNPPAGATITPHHSEPNIQVLRFVPTTTGLISLNLLARDAIEPNLTADKTIEVDIRPSSDFIREGESLRSLASARGLRIGYASFRDVYYRPDGALYSRTAAKEFNFVTPENSLKWGFLNPVPGRYRWSSADNLVSFAKQNGLEVHGHTLVWYTFLPDWIKFSAVKDREVHMREFIDRVLNRYADDIPVWDVVNEALEDDGSYRNSVWHEAMGPSFVEIAFKQARESAPNAELLYNDYDVAWNGPKSTSMFNLLQALKDKEVPLDGVGFQMHVYADFDKFDEVEANFQKAANMDLDIYITELDVSMLNGQTEAQQAEVYRRTLDICLEQPRCKGFQSWGFTDNYSWRRQYNPLLLDAAYQTKPAYRALQQRLTEN